MSVYIPQGFKSGQILTAAQLNYIEEGIAKILPAIEAGEQQLVTDENGNVVWESKTHGWTMEDVEVFPETSFTADSGMQRFGKVTETLSVGQDYTLVVNGVNYYGQITTGSFGQLAAEGGGIKLLGLSPSANINLTNTTGVAGTFILYVKQKKYNTMDAGYLPIVVREGEGVNSIVLNSIKPPYAKGNYSVGANDGTAEGTYSFATGSFTLAKGSCSFAQGFHAEARGEISSAEGRHTIAAADSQHVQGKYNIEDTEEKYAHIIGNGTDANTRSNAHTIDWQGNGWFAGDVEGNSMIVKSSTEGSNKRFKITVDDNGTISATEIVE